MIVMGLASCGKKEFKVNVNLKNTDENTMIYLRKIVDNEVVMVDSATFKNELAVLKAPFDDAQRLYTLRVKGMRGAMIFFPENKNISVVGDINNSQDVVILGADAQTRYNDYNKGYGAFNERMMALYDQMEEAYTNGDTVTLETLNEQGTQIMDEQNAYRDDYIKTHGDDFLGHYILDESKQDYTLADLKEMVAGFTTESLYSKDLNDYIAKLESLEVGQPFIDFTLVSSEGEEINLGNFVKENTLTLVDFWASWCGPCRKENPVVLAAYNKYHEAGFNVLGVSVDQDEAAWRKAFQEDNLPWAHVRDIDGKASEQYLVYYIPSNVLIDANGIIVAKNLRGEDLEKELSNRL